MRDHAPRGSAVAQHISARVLGSKTDISTDAPPPLSPSMAFSDLLDLSHTENATADVLGPQVTGCH